MRARIPLVLVLASALLALAASLSGARMDSATDDEPAHVFSGYVKRHFGVFDTYAGEPPLVQMLLALPLPQGRFSVRAGWQGDPNTWHVGRGFLYRSGNDADEILLRSRSVVMVLFLLTCGSVACLVHGVARDARFAALGFVLAALCPTLLAHGRLATVDVGTTLFTFATAACFLLGVLRDDRRWLALAGLALAASVLSKVSALILLPWLAAVVLLHLAVRRELSAGSLARWLGRGAGIVALAVLAMQAFYAATIHPEYVRRAHPEIAGSFFGWALVPFLEYRDLFREILGYVAGDTGHPQYLLGRYSSFGWWWFYPVAFAIKTPLATLALTAATVLVAARVLAGGAAERLRRDPRAFALVACLLFVVLFWAVAMRSRITLSIRYLLPTYPFLYAAIALAAALVWDALPSRRRLLAAALGVACAWNAAEVVRVHPSYLGYFNPLVGMGPQSDRWLVDSNLDWGQDLKRLARWVEENGVDRIHTIYFGGGDVERELGDRAIPWSSHRPREPGLYAVSRHLYRITGGYPLIPDLALYFAGAKPVAIVGTSLYVFEVE